jgi:hypothetical protein
MRIITHIFPNRVNHFNANCQKDSTPIEAFLSTHFKLGGNNPNPRLVLLFLSFTFEQSSYYYSRNPDKEKIQPNDLNEYELILQEHLVSGYRKVQDTVRQTVSHLNPERKKYVDRLLFNIDKPKKSRSLNFELLKKYTDWDLSNEEFHSFVAFFTHIGLLVPDNPTFQFEKRAYSFPVIITKCPA